MTLKTPSNKWTVVILGLLAAICFNNWFLGPFLNHNLFIHNGSVSEYSVSGQPHFMVFRALDIFAGLLLAILALALYKTLASRRYGRLLPALVALLGIANIFDAIFTLPCSETLNPGCSVPISLSLGHFQLPAHAYSSVIIAACYLLVPVAGILYSRKSHMKILFRASWLSTAVAVLSLLSASLQYLASRSLSVRTSGAGQEVQMVIIGFWIAVWSFELARAKPIQPAD